MTNTETKIRWTKNRYNFMSGCTKVSAGCKNCYAENQAKRLLAGKYGYPERPNHFKVTLHPDKLLGPLKVRKPSMFFACTMGDLFHEDVAFEYLRRAWSVMALLPQHTFQVLTKRPARMLEFLLRGPESDSWEIDNWPEVNPEASVILEERNKSFAEVPWPLPNVWLGTSAEDQETFNKRVGELVRCPGAVHFVSLEPLLGPVDVSPHLPCPDCDGRGWYTVGNPFDQPAETESCKTCIKSAKKIGESVRPGNYVTRSAPTLDWVICGGETGTGARPMHPDWARSIRDQCKEAGVPFFFKQWGEWAPLPEPFRYSPTIGSDNRDYNKALKRYARKHGASCLLGDRREGWEPYMLRQGEAIGDGEIAIGRVGRTHADNLLDGVKYEEFPNVQ